MAIQVVKEEKFKDVAISVRFKNKLDKEHVIMKTLLSNMLEDSCEMLPDKASISKYLNDLYGASYSTNPATYGQTYILEFRVRAINSSYIENKMNLQEKQVDLLENFILKPYMENGLFLKKHLDEAKRSVLQKIKRNLDEPSQYAVYKAFSTFGKDQPIGVQIYDYTKDIEQVSVEDISAYYRNMLEEDQIDIVVMGDVDKEAIRSSLNTHFNTNKNLDVKSYYKLKKEEFDSSYTYFKDIHQAHIVMLYATNQDNHSDDFWKLYVANAILGMTPSSLLFREVREKHSLCYSVFSSLLAYEGGLMISTGIDPKNLKKAQSLIYDQVERVRDGDFSDELLQTSKEVLMNSFRNTKDEMNGYLNMEYRSIVLGIDDTIEDYIEKIKAVRKEDVQEAMKHCEFISSVIVRKE